MDHRRFSKFKRGFSLFLIIFITGNLGFYILERSKWIYKGQPYPDAKEWLVPANMMLVYTTLLNRLPFIDERSYVMKPLLGLQNYFANNWQQRLPDDDAEKYLRWYIFELMAYIVPNGGGIVLYGSRHYSFDEVIVINEKTWETLENIVRYSARDKEFLEMRYAAFNNLSTLYATNFTAYWAENPKKGYRVIPYKTIELRKKYLEPDLMVQTTGNRFEKIRENRYLQPNTYINTQKMFADIEKHQRLIKLYRWIKEMDKLYKTKHPKIYQKIQSHPMADYWRNSRMHKLLVNLINFLIVTERYREDVHFCDPKHKGYIADYIRTRKWLVKNRDALKKKGIIIDKMLSQTTDARIEKACPSVKLSDY